MKLIHCLSVSSLRVLLSITCMASSRAYADEIRYTLDQYALYAGGNITLKDRTKLTGPAGAAGNLTLNYDTVVTGELFSGNDFSAKDRFNITGTVRSGEDSTMGYDGKLTGSIQSDGNISALDRVAVSGDMNATGSINLRSSTVVSGEVNDHSTLPDEWTAPTITAPTFTYGTTSVTVNDRQSLTLSPGTYGELYLHSGVILNLSSGVYNFQKAFFHTDVTLNIDDSSGPVEMYFWSDTDLSMKDRGRIVIKSGSSSGLTFWSRGTLRFEHGCTLVGRFRTLKGVSFGNNGTLLGSLYAGENLSLGYDFVVVHQNDGAGGEGDGTPERVRMVHWREIGVDKDR